MNKKTFLIALLPFVILLVLSIVFSRYDDRPVDGNLTYGFPFPVYYKTAGFGSPEASGLDFFGLGMDSLLIYGVALAGTVGLTRFWKKN